MNMQSALDLAKERDCCARPVGQDAVAYRYKRNGKRYLLAVSGRKGKESEVVEEFCPALSRDEIAGDWELCAIASDPLGVQAAPSSSTFGRVLRLRDLGSL